MGQQEEWGDLKKILCIRTDNMGDVLMTEPALRSLKKVSPNREIHLLTSVAGSRAAALISYIGKTITCDPPWTGGALEGEDLQALISTIRKENYDGAVIFNVYSQTPMPAAMLCYLAGITNVAAYSRENPYRLISTWIPDEEPLYRIQHEVSRQLDLASAVGGTRVSKRIKIRINDADSNTMKQKLLALTRQPFILVHPGVSEEKRKYPWELFAEAIRQIREETGVDILLTGSASEKALNEKIVTSCGKGVHSAAGLFSLAELAALISAAPLLISNNSGPVHLAAAVGTPVVVLYAQTNPQHTPWMVDHVLLPFDVPESKRSKNTIVRFAHEQSFNTVGMIEPSRIAHATNLLLYRKQKHQLFKQ